MRSAPGMGAPPRFANRCMRQYCQAAAILTDYLLAPSDHGMQIEPAPDLTVGSRLWPAVRHHSPDPITNSSQRGRPFAHHLPRFQHLRNYRLTYEQYAAPSVCILRTSRRTSVPSATLKPSTKPRQQLQLEHYITSRL